MSFLDDNGLLYLWQKLNSKFATSEDLGAMATARTYTSTIPSTGWSSTAPYYVDVEVVGLSGNDSPIISPIYTGELATDQTIQEAWNKVTRIVASADKLRIYAFEEIPTTAIPINIQVVSGGTGDIRSYMVTLTQAEYDQLVENGTVDENTYYFIKEG